MSDKISIKNKKALFEYALLETYTAGIQLLGTEIKALRDGKANLVDAYCLVINDELFVKNLHIAEYSHGSYANHEPKRMRKLLLTGRELKKIRTRAKEKGLTIIPVHLFINEKGLAKLEIAVAKGKKLHDKRDTMKDRDVKRELDRARKNF